MWKNYSLSPVRRRLFCSTFRWYCFFFQCFAKLFNLYFLLISILALLREKDVILSHLAFMFSLFLKCPEVHAPCSAEVVGEHAHAMGTD